MSDNAIISTRRDVHWEASLTYVPSQSRLSFLGAVPCRASNPISAWISWKAGMMEVRYCTVAGGLSSSTRMRRGTHVEHTSNDTNVA